MSDSSVKPTSSSKGGDRGLGSLATTVFSLLTLIGVGLLWNKVDGWQRAAQVSVPERLGIEVKQEMQTICIRQDVPCGRATVHIETCCQSGETFAECKARHDKAVQEVLEACGD